MIFSFHVNYLDGDVTLLECHKVKRKNMKLFYFFLRSLGPNVVVTKHLSYTTKAVYNDAVCEHKGSIKLKRKGKTMSDGPSVALQAIVERLVLLSESQKLIEEAKGEYAGWYANESDEMPTSRKTYRWNFGNKPSTFSQEVIFN